MKCNESSIYSGTLWSVINICNNSSPTGRHPRWVVSFKLEGILSSWNKLPSISLPSCICQFKRLKCNFSTSWLCSYNHFNNCLIHHVLAGSSSASFPGNSTLPMSSRRNLINYWAGVWYISYKNSSEIWYYLWYLTDVYANWEMSYGTWQISYISWLWDVSCQLAEVNTSWEVYQ